MSHIKLYSEGAFWYAGSGYVKELKEIVADYCAIMRQKGRTLPDNLVAFSSGSGEFADTIYDAYISIDEAASNGDVDAERTLKEMEEYMDFTNRFPNYFAVKDNLDLNIALAERIDAYSQALLGDRYYYGEKVEQNYEKALEWFKKAALQGEPLSQYNLGGCYELGRGVLPSKEKAYSWYQKAAEQGLREAKRAIRRIELERRGVTEDVLLTYRPTYIWEDEKGKALTDEYGVMYSENGKRLLKAPSDIMEYSIKEGTQVICDYAFRESKITKITIPDSVVVIGDDVFHGCRKLHSICLPSALREIGDSAFQYSGLTSIEIPKGVVIIGNDVFRECYSLKSIAISNTVNEIGTGLTVWCKHLKSITVEQGNPVYDSRNNSNAIIERKSGSLIAGSNTTVIPESVTAIVKQAFWGCDTMTSINIPSGVREIGEQAFFRCEKLKTVTMGDGVRKIEMSAFEECNKLTTVKLSVGLTDIDDCAFKECKSLENIELPDSLITIGSEAFDGCDSIKSLVIPDSVKKIDDDAFEFCRQLTSLILPLDLKKIPRNAFYECYKLSSVSFPTSLKIIGEYALRNCYAIKTIVIPQDVELIEREAFAQCDHLQSVSFRGANLEIEEDVFDGCTALSTIHIPAGSRAHFEQMLPQQKELLSEGEYG